MLRFCERKNGEASTNNAVKTQVRIFSEKMQTVSRDIPGLLTSRDTVIGRLNTLHGIVVKLAEEISPPKRYRNARPTTCEKSGYNISCCNARNKDRGISLA